eukprot:gene6764-7474_t
MPQQVKRTDFISFDEDFKTFRLVAGNSLYAISISPELTLEHLYWGQKLPEGYDLRYLSQNTRLAHFNTVEAAPHSLNGKIVIEAETLEDIAKTWRENMNSKLDENNVQEHFHKRRLENYSWRLMSILVKSGLLTPHAVKSKSSRARSGSVPESYRPETSSNKSSTSSGDHDGIEAKGDENGESSNNSQFQQDTRRRSISMPVQPILSHSSLQPNSPETVKLRSDEPSYPVCDIPAPFPNVTTTPLRREHRKELDGGLLSTTKSSTRNHNRRQTFDRQLGMIGKGGLCVEYADYGTGDFRSPSFLIVDHSTGSSISPLRYRRHKIYRGKLPLGDDVMPSVRCLNDGEASTLIITLADLHSQLEVDLVYVSMHNYDVITRRAVFRNTHPSSGPKPHIEGCGISQFDEERGKVIQKASSVSLDFEYSSSSFYLTQMAGSWARERYIVETKLNPGMYSYGSTRGVSSHQHSPFTAITEGPPSETSGETKGVALIYSGNFLVEAEINEMGRLRLNMGIHPMGLQWYLKEGGIFHTPEAVLARSSEGLGGMSRTLHRLILDRIIPRHWSDDHPPILLNSWEAKYFHVNHDGILEMAKQAVKIGVDMIVLDDGWFGERNNDHTSLGDWIVNLQKFPYGLKQLVEEVNSLGLKFGLWFEPEMVSEHSALFAAHPDWAFHVPGRPRQIGRNQMVLDLSRQDVRDHIYNSVAAVLSGANIEYIKWDMNRPLTEVYSILAGLGEVWQAEISHRYMLGVYELQGRIVKNFPHILFENCASGGGRFDLGMLYYSPQIWCSDNTDALVRMRIQYGTSLAYPARCIGAHVSIVPNHLTGNTTRLRTRGFVAMCGTFGYELDVSQVTPADRLIFQKQCDFYRQIAPIVRWGDIYRLWDPFKMSLAAWMYVTRDKSQAVVFAFSLNSDHWSNLVPRLQLQGLIPDAIYEVCEPFPNNLTQSAGTLMLIESEVPIYQLGVSSVCLNGQILMSAGLPLRFYTLDDSVAFQIAKYKYL